MRTTRNLNRSSLSHSNLIAFSRSLSPNCDDIARKTVVKFSNDERMCDWETGGSLLIAQGFCLRTDCAHRTMMQRDGDVLSFYPHISLRMKMCSRIKISRHNTHEPPLVNAEP